MPSTKGRDRGRKRQHVRRLRRILILCEDEKSSRDYLERFPIDKSQVEIECVGTGKNMDSLMEDAIKRSSDARENGAPYERVWVVFDRDDFPERNLRRAFDLAKNQREIEPCLSNECFELWYLLHFAYRDTGITRRNIWKEVSRLTGQKYDKADASIFDLLEGLLEDGLRNAKRLAYENAMRGEERRNPSTRVHEVVEILREFDPKKQ